MKALAAIAGLSLFPALALAEDCKAIQEATARLTCYDNAAKPKAAPKRAPIIDVPLSSAMNELRSRLDKALLEAAIDIQVMAISKRDQFTSGKLPQLMLFGYMNRASVYQIITKTDLIRQAREAGFQSIDAFSKSDGHWIFDLSGSGQTCSRDLCF